MMKLLMMKTRMKTHCTHAIVLNNNDVNIAVNDVTNNTSGKHILSQFIIGTLIGRLRYGWAMGGIHKPHYTV